MQNNTALQYKLPRNAETIYIFLPEIGTEFYLQAESGPEFFRKWDPKL